MAAQEPESGASRSVPLLLKERFAEDKSACGERKTHKVVLIRKM